METSEVIKEKENPLFHRKEIEVIVEADVSPRYSEAEDFLSKQFSAPIENIKIKRIMGKFGSHKFRITANIYTSKEIKDKIEPKEKKKKGAPAPTEAPAEPKAETKTE
jgi:ribosomal protein S24E